MEAFDTCLARLALGIRSGEMTVRLRRRDGQYIWCKVTYTKLDDGESNERYIGTLNDVDAATRSEQALRLRAEHDPLTGAYNTQTFLKKSTSSSKADPTSSTAYCDLTWPDSRPSTNHSAWKKATACCVA